jgi:hypothetical protein
MEFIDQMDQQVDELNDFNFFFFFFKMKSKMRNEETVEKKNFGISSEKK